ncbi:Uncharacterised protein [Candidatus Bilamarchaeum dharawalense]|uniref:Uncharacterized protein n=1 Tax=Candidatus Bilamarchaeum dharawalense TaxID=2885759 RepID=A0A5E4LUQ2_9ARCH|nr:Uncharacterised protein [Candidatus Bilamarchaeum dharawalense]
MEIRREVLLIIFLLLIIAVLVKLVEFFQVGVFESDASKFVREDLRSKYPTADIDIMTMTPMESGKYLEVKAKVTLGADTPCPERTHIFYNYPAQNFVPQTPEVITSNCVVCVVGLCTIAFPEEAIIASHTLPGTGDISNYILSNTNAMPTVKEKSDSWEVSWDSQTATYSYVVDIHRNGTILDVTPISK